MRIPGNGGFGVYFKVDSTRNNKCKKCGVPIGSNSRTLECRKCHRHPHDAQMRRPYYRMKMYGLSHSDFKGLLLLQGGKCPICKVDLVESPPDGTRSNIHVDHNHETGAVNGLLCSRCNPGRGYWHNDEATLARAIVWCRRERLGPNHHGECDELERKLMALLFPSSTG